MSILMQILSLFFLYFVVLSKSFEIRRFADFVSKSNTKNAVLIFCPDQPNLKTSAEQLMKNYVSTSFINIEDVKTTEDFFRPKPFFTHVYFNLECLSTPFVLNQLSNRRLFNASRNFFISTTSGEFNSSIELLGKQNINLDSKIFLHDSTKDQLYTVSSIERYKNTPLFINPINRSDQAPTKRRLNLNGHTLFVCTNVSLSFIT